MVDEVVEHLHRTGVLHGEATVLELGCGPGTYSLRVAPLVRSMACLDTSKSMLDRLLFSAGELGLTNIRVVMADFAEHVPEERSSVVMASLCPGTASVDGLRRMESCAKDHCAHITWTSNGWDDLHAKVWNEMGKDYSFEARGSDLAARNLRSMGREPEITGFSAEMEHVMPLERAVSEFVRDFSAFGRGLEAEPFVRKVLEPLAKGGEFRYRSHNSMRLLVWDV